MAYAVYAHCDISRQMLLLWLINWISRKRCIRPTGETFCGQNVRGQTHRKLTNGRNVRHYRRLVRYRFRSVKTYRVGQKMAQFVLNTLTLSNINRFSKFFHCQNHEKICRPNNIITEDLITPQVCRYTTLWNVRKSWFRLACQEWGRLASSSSSREPRFTANISPTVNMFSVADYLTPVHDASATTLQQDGAPSHTDVPAAWERHVHRAWHVAPKQPGLESSWLRCWVCTSADINVDDSRQSTS